MKLKGKVLEKLPKEKREKMERTLKKMEDVRVKDDKNLRHKINQKLIWIEDEIKKGNDAVELHRSQIDSIKAQIFKLIGARIALKDLLDGG